MREISVDTVIRCICAVFPQKLIWSRSVFTSGFYPKEALGATTTRRPNFIGWFRFKVHFAYLKGSITTFFIPGRSMGSNPSWFLSIINYLFAHWWLNILSRRVMQWLYADDGTDHQTRWWMTVEYLQKTLRMSTVTIAIMTINHLQDHYRAGFRLFHLNRLCMLLQPVLFCHVYRAFRKSWWSFSSGEKVIRRARNLKLVQMNSPTNCVINFKSTFIYIIFIHILQK